MAIESHSHGLVSENNNATISWNGGYATSANGNAIVIGSSSSSGYTVAIHPTPEEPKSEIDRLLGEVEAVCKLAR